MRRLFALSLLCLGLAACGTTQLPMTYAPTVQPASVSRPVVAVGAVTDQRQDGRENPYWIGTIRDGFGIPMKRLEAPSPVTEVVRQAFADALAARGMLAPAAPRYVLNVTILQFDANQYSRREATVEFMVTLTTSSNAQVLTDRERAYQVGGSVITLSRGIFGSVEDLRGIALSTMSQAIDRILDKPGFAAALR
ncbi:YajG family lipoprotein [Pseudoroseomonas ludipueritiae]|uniref:Lipoprotein n=1 Tax=Pseudoroseomonas ludipueritiae TaxID=198093 RepID=A0ABR7RA21_9PROT|nr:hypothetical protein [Pseudoroseomonas ludipueritiae]MBC9178337.1 hypothetical protein [Pseudoroseomonas ludipueritiae]MCG7360289.1 hypothetical protein [Roseomonas sp. ACRSG]